MEKQAIKELLYGGIKELMNNGSYYYKSSIGRQYSNFSDRGREALNDFVTDMAGFIIEAENKDLDQRAKDMVVKELKGN